MRSGGFFSRVVELPGKRIRLRFRGFFRVFSGKERVPVFLRRHMVEGFEYMAEIAGIVVTEGFSNIRYAQILILQHGQGVLHPQLFDIFTEAAVGS